MNLKNILWDFDGVILESVQAKTEAFRELYKCYGEEISDQVVEHHLSNGGMSRFEKFKIYSKEFLNKEITDKEIKDLSKTFSDLALNNVINSKFTKGAREFISSSQDEYNHFIISATPHEEMHKIAEAKEIDKFFKGIMGSPKSKTEWLTDLIKHKIIKRENSLFIGDASADLKSAENTKIKFLLRKHDLNRNEFSNYEYNSVENFINFNPIDHFSFKKYAHA